nr:L-lactate permease [Caldalkalibacillus thermarum]
MDPLDHGRKETFDFEERSKWEPQWIGKLNEVSQQSTETPAMSLLRAWSPYIIVAGLLVITRTVDTVQAALRHEYVTLSITDIFGSGISTSSQPLYLPGFIFIVASLATYFIHNMSKKRHYIRAWSDSLKTTFSAATALIFAVPMVQVFLNSATDELASMPLVLAEGVSNMVGGLWPMFAPAIGALGAFISGSNTVSNMMFSLFQFGTAESIGLGATGAGIVVALQAVGGAAGNMICVHNVVAASATVGLVDREGDLIRQALIPMTYYILAAGVLGMALITGGANPWYLAWLVIIGLFLAFMLTNKGAVGEQNISHSLQK